MAQTFAQAWSSESWGFWGGKCSLHPLALCALDSSAALAGILTGPRSLLTWALWSLWSVGNQSKPSRRLPCSGSQTGEGAAPFPPSRRPGLWRGLMVAQSLASQLPCLQTSRDSHSGSFPPSREPNLPPGWPETPAMRCSCLETPIPHSRPMLGQAP